MNDVALAGAPTSPTATTDVRAAVKPAVRDYREAGGITAAAVPASLRRPSCARHTESPAMTASTFNALAAACDLKATGIEYEHAEDIAHPAGPSGYTPLWSHRPRRMR